MLRWINILGVVAGLTAAVFLLLQRPVPVSETTTTASNTGLPDPFPPQNPAGGPVQNTTVPPPEPIAATLALPHPPVLDPNTFGSAQQLRFAVHLEDGTGNLSTSLGELDLRGAPSLTIDPDDLGFGVNLIRMTGHGAFNHPLDRAWPLIVANAEDRDPWVRRALWLRLGREGFDDDDELLDDLSSIAHRYVVEALANLGTLSAGPVTMSNFRPGQVLVSLWPRTNGIGGRLDLRDIDVDIELDVIGDVGRLQINRLWLDIELTVIADQLGRPFVRVHDVSPHMDLLRERDGVGNWILDRLAWVPEIIAELAAEGPIEEALLHSIDQTLDGWIDRFHFTAQAPLSPVELEVSYRFDELLTSDEGWTVAIDFRIDCVDAVPRPLSEFPRLLRRPRGGPLEPSFDFRGDAVLAVWLHSDTPNAALDALWRCGALDASVSFDSVSDELRAVIPELVTTRFDFPPTVQNDATGGLAIGAADVHAELVYPDGVYGLRASGILPIRLSLDEDGRSLEVGFDPDRDRLSLFTDCEHVNGVPCHDNPLFDRLAWFAVPWLPPIGATVPLPDVRLASGSDDTVQLRLNSLDWSDVDGVIRFSGRYEMAP